MINLDSISIDNLYHNKYNYEFEEAEITLDDGYNIILDGVFDVELEEVDDSFEHAFGTEVIEPYFQVTEARVTITQMRDLECLDISLNREDKEKCISMIEEYIINQDVEIDY